jgi:hypothetical protein
MHRIACTSLAVIVALALVGAARAGDEREGRPRFKGVELYSWRDARTGWTFALLDGTNRLKTAAEVKESRNRIAGVEGLKKALARLAVGEQVFWTHPIEGFEYPPEATVQEVRVCARRLNITLHTPEPMHTAEPMN